MNPQKSAKAAVHVSFSDYTNSEKHSAESSCVTDDVIDATSRLSANTNTARDDKRCSANASNITLDADGKPMFRPKSPAMGRASGTGKVLTRKSTPANLPKVGKILGKWMKLDFRYLMPRACAENSLFRNQTDHERSNSMRTHVRSVITGATLSRLHDRASNCITNEIGCAHNINANITQNVCSVTRCSIRKSAGFCTSQVKSPSPTRQPSWKVTKTQRHHVEKPSSHKFVLMRCRQHPQCRRLPRLNFEAKTRRHTRHFVDCTKLLKLYSDEKIKRAKFAYFCTLRVI